MITNSRRRVTSSCLLDDDLRLRAKNSGRMTTIWSLKGHAHQAPAPPPKTDIPALKERVDVYAFLKKIACHTRMNINIATS